MEEILIKKELVSIVMPAYNSEGSIRDSVDSVISQSFSNWELIIIDDGSTDNTLNIINEYCGVDSRIQSYPNDKNMGVSKTRNKGIKITKGTWIAFLDSDDIWVKEKLEKQMLSIENDNSSFVYTGARYINQDGVEYKGTFSVPKSVNYKQLRKQNVISTSSVLVRKEMIGNLKFENDKIHEDYALWLKVLKKNNISAFGLDEQLLVYRLYRDSKSGNKLNSIRMTYGVFREVGLNVVSSMYFTVSHLYRSIFKYKEILKG